MNDYALIVMLIVLGWWFPNTRAACAAGIIVIQSANFLNNIRLEIKRRKAFARYKAKHPEQFKDDDPDFDSF